MGLIILEGVLFVALGVTVATLIFYVLGLTPLGMRFRQTRNRRRIERAAELSCPVHGPHEEAALVRLSSGDRICPECFKEAVDGRVD